jgi:hypothetical protein
MVETWRQFPVPCQFPCGRDVAALRASGRLSAQGIFALAFLLADKYLVPFELAFSSLSCACAAGAPACALKGLCMHAGGVTPSCCFKSTCAPHQLLLILTGVLTGYLFEVVVYDIRSMGHLHLIGRSCWLGLRTIRFICWLLLAKHITF